jgi:ferrochelatase
MSNHEQNPMPTDAPFDALLIVSYGGPEGPDEVLPFLENVLHGRNVSQQQLDAAAAKYHAIGGASPVNEECRALIGGLLQEVDAGLCPHDAIAEPRINEIFAQVRQLPIYWGNLFWHPLLEDTIADMAEEGMRRVIVFCTFPFGTEHSTRSYSGAIDAAVKKVNIPDFVVQQTRLFYNHPLFISTMADRLAETLAMRIDWGNALPPRDDRSAILSRLPDAANHFVLFTAHSVPVTDAEIESYQSQLKHACSQVADLMQLDQCGIDWGIAWQSHGGSHGSWCSPDVAEFVKKIPERFPGKKTVIVCPIGFMLENMELLHDLDLELRQLCESRGLEYDRTLPVSGHRKAIAMIRELVAEVYSPLVPRRYLGKP